MSTSHATTSRATDVLQHTGYATMQCAAEIATLTPAAEWFHPQWAKYAMQNFPGGPARNAFTGSCCDPYLGYVPVDDFLTGGKSRQLFFTYDVLTEDVIQSRSPRWNPYSMSTTRTFCGATLAALQSFLVLVSLAGSRANHMISTVHRVFVVQLCGIPRQTGRDEQPLRCKSGLRHA